MISVFLSTPMPHQAAQARFIDGLREYLRGRGLAARTLGVSDYDMNAPLAGVRRLMWEACGFIGLGLQRAYFNELFSKRGADLPNVNEIRLQQGWLTSPFVQIETAMAYQLGLPILIARERGVVAEGVLEKGVTGYYLPEIDLQSTVPSASDEWNAILNQWEAKVRNVYERRGAPPNWRAV